MSEGHSSARYSRPRTKDDESDATLRQAIDLQLEWNGDPFTLEQEEAIDSLQFETFGAMGPRNVRRLHKFDDWTLWLQNEREKREVQDKQEKAAERWKIEELKRDEEDAMKTLAAEAEDEDTTAKVGEGLGARNTSTNDKDEVMEK